MEQTALRPKSLPGSPGSDPGGTGPNPPRDPRTDPRGKRRPHAARRRGRRLATWLTGMLVAVVLLLAGVGIGTVGTGVIALSRMAQMQQAQQQRPAPSGQPAGQPSGRPSARPSGHPSVPSTAAPGPTRVAVGGRLGIEVVDAPTGPGALVVAVHEPGPGYTAGLVRGDVLLHLGTAAIGSASDLAAVVTDAQPGRELSLKVRHRNGREQELTVVPGVTI